MLVKESGLAWGGCFFASFFAPKKVRNSYFDKKHNFYAKYLFLSYKSVTFAPEKWNRFPLVPILSIY